MVISGNNLVVNGTTVEQADLINISTITSDVQTQLNGKQATLVSGTNIKTINGSSLLASGDIAVGNLSDAAHTFSGNGYQKLSNGLIIQWGSTSSVSDRGTITVTLPIAFPTSFTSVTCQNNSGTNDQYMNGSKATIASTSSFSLFHVGAAESYYWFAIGY